MMGVSTFLFGHGKNVVDRKFEDTNRRFLKRLLLKRRYEVTALLLRANWYGISAVDKAELSFQIWRDISSSNGRTLVVMGSACQGSMLRDFSAFSEFEVQVCCAASIEHAEPVSALSTLLEAVH